MNKIQSPELRVMRFPVKDIIATSDPTAVNKEYSPSDPLTQRRTTIWE